MIRFILGSKGSGKTKWLVDRANTDIREGNGNIVFIDVDHEHIFNLDREVRLVNAMEFNIDSIESFYGFLSGILARDYDVEKVYIDSLYKLIDIAEEEMDYLLVKLLGLAQVFDTSFYMNVDYEFDEMPVEFRNYSLDLDRHLDLV